MKNYIGKTCPFCKTEIKKDDSVKICRACGVPHHKSCWKENNGCANLDCSERNCKKHHTNSDNICPESDAISDGNELTAECGVAEDVPKKIICAKCGTELQENQAFCQKCGQKQDVVLQSETNSAIAEFNKHVENDSKKKKRNKKLKIILCVLISLLSIAAILFVIFELYLISGSYVLVSSKMNSTYTFDDGKYVYDSGDYDDETEIGSYELKIGEVSLFDEDGNKTTFGRMGKYLYYENSEFEEKLDKESNKEQVFSKTSESNDISLYMELRLDGNGGYKFSGEMSCTVTYTDYEYEYYGYYYGYVRVPVTREKVVSSNILDESGRYEISGNKLILKPDGEGEKVFLIKDGYIYSTVYEKIK